MSRTATVTVLCLATIIGFAFSRANTPTSHRSSGKQLIFNEETAASKLGITNKLHSGIKMTVVPSNDDEFEANRDYGLTVLIEAPTDLKNVKLAWGLPPNITLVSGSISQTIPELREGEAQQYSIVIRSSSPDNARIHVRALVNNGRKRFNEIVHYNTVHQKVIDEQKKELAKRTLKAIEREPASRLKIYK